jgi:hypothetical protein
MVSLKLFTFVVFLIALLVNQSCLVTPDVDLKKSHLGYLNFIFIFFCQDPVFAAIEASRDSRYFIKLNLCFHSGLIFKILHCVAHIIELL